MNVIASEGQTVAFQLDATVNCAKCGAPFAFWGLVPTADRMLDRPTVSMDGMTARLPILSPASVELKILERTPAR